MSEVAKKRGPGRPRKFDEGDALDAAIALFWAQGYDATSLDDLGGAMGLARPSIYRAFGAKDQLFLKAMIRYRDTTAAAPLAALAGVRDVRAGLEAFLDAVIAYTNADGSHAGCLIGSIATAVDDDAIRAFAQASVAGVQDGVATWAADVAPDLDAPAVARRATDAMLALTARARLGAAPAELRAAVPDHVATILGA